MLAYRFYCFACKKSLLHNELRLNHALGATSQRLEIIGLTMRKTSGMLVIALAVLFVVTGRLLLAVPLFIFGLTLLGRNPWAAVIQTRQSSGTRIRTTLLDVEIDKQTGAIRGRVVGGRFARRTIGSLSAHEAGLLWREARLKDPPSAQIVEALLDRIDPRWRELHGQKASGGGQEGASAKTQIDLKEAYSVLGLLPGATRADVHRVHRELMKRFHPDQGGSNYLAAKINEAKDFLLARLPE